MKAVHLVPAGSFTWSAHSITIFSDILNDEILIYQFNGELRAVSSFCPHFGGPLEYKDKSLSCYWHGWRFDPETFVCTNHEVNCKVKSYSVIETDRGLEISDVS